MNNLVSVIVPIYNSEKYLKECINSIINQTYINIEIILINDGSNDNSLNIISEYQAKDKRIKIINKNNTGVSDSRNKGIDVATGKYIMFIDSDDWIEKDYIKELVRKTEDEKLDICRTGFIIEKNDNKIHTINYADKGEMFIDNDFEKNFIETTIFHSACVQLIRTSIIRDNNIYFDRNIIFEEDLIFNINVFRHCNKIKYINFPFYHYRANQDSATRNLENIPKIINSIFESNKEMISLSQQKCIDLNLERKINTKHFKIIVMYLYQALQKDIHLFKKICKKIDHREFTNIIKKIDDNEFTIKEKIKKYIIVFMYKVYQKNIKLNIILKIRRLKYKLLIKNKNFSIISNDCCGGCIYNDMGLRFLTPTINLYISNDDFIKYIYNLTEYNKLELKFKECNSKYPIAILENRKLDPIEIHFMHYKNCTEAKKKWTERKNRINYNNIIVLFHLNEERIDLVNKFIELDDYNKICLYYSNMNNIKRIEDSSLIEIPAPKKFESGKILERYGFFKKRFLEKINYIKIFNNFLK